LPLNVGAPVDLISGCAGISFDFTGRPVRIFSSIFDRIVQNPNSG
jgi:hypothetical protein